MSDPEHDVTRRDFVKHSALLAATSAAWCGTTLKTDALAQAPAPVTVNDDAAIPYMYHGENP